MLPLLRDEAHRAPDTISHLLDCDACQRDLDEETRLDLGCGYRERSVERPEGMWSHVAYPAALDEHRRVCVGWSTKLPAVTELVQIRKHWERGSVRDRYGELPEVVWERVEAMDAAEQVASAHAMRQLKKP